MGLQSWTASIATPGTKQRITDSPTPAMPTLSGALSGTITPRGTNITITSDPANTASKSVFLGSASLSVSGNTGWFAKLAPGASFVVAEISGGATDAADIYYDTDGTTAKIGVELIG
jgi:hypothetical protein